MATTKKATKKAAKKAVKKAAQKEKDFDQFTTTYDELKKQMEATKKHDLQHHRDEIKQLLEGEIVSRYYYQTGELESNFKNDKELKKAIDVLNDNKLYSSILAGEGSYKVIGKPGTTDQALTGSESEDWEKN